MESNQILLQGITLENLQTTLLEGIDRRIEELVNKDSAPVEYLTRKEVADLLSISLPTVHDWVNKGILKAYRMGNRVYFKSSEVDQSLRPVNK
jgi:excisionase family DNA binding protein